MSSDVPVPDAWSALRRFTAARIATGRVGGSLPTADLLRFDLDHAFARDAVHSELDLAALDSALGQVAGASGRVHVTTRAPDRTTYLQRPAVGRRLDDASRARLEQLARTDRPDIAIIIADGLSAIAAQMHAPALLRELLPRLRRSNLSNAPLILARYARVALEDDVGQCLNAQSSLILLGERFGLAAADSLSAYYVFQPRIGNTDADRNCVSNIRPGGLPIAAAAETLEYLVTHSHRLRLSGTKLKDDRLPTPQSGRLLAPGG